MFILLHHTDVGIYALSQTGCLFLLKEYRVTQKVSHQVSQLHHIPNNFQNSFTHISNAALH